jgi:hypothetical protein
VALNPQNRLRIEIPGGAGGTEEQRVAQALRDLRGRVPNMGRTILDFGAAPGAPDARVQVIDQAGIVEGSQVLAWLFPVATPDHSADEHVLEQLKIVAGQIVPGVGFTIFGLALAPLVNAHGKWTVAWMWS